MATRKMTPTAKRRSKAAGASGSRALGYDAAETSKRRKAPCSTITSEDAVVTSKKRDTLVGGARDVARNFAIAAWAIRRHLDYVVSHKLHCRTGNAEFDVEFQKWFVRITSADVFDVAGRHPFDRYLRLMEAAKVVGGDLGNLFLQTGHLQAIESDLIRDPEDKRDDTIHGVRTDIAGRAIAYHVRPRGRNGKGYGDGRWIPADSFFLHAQFDRFDQYRGIAPIVSGLNSLRDLYEGFDYGLAKLKVEQLFCMAIFRKEGVELPGTETESAERGKYKVDMGNGPVLLDLDPGDDAKFLKSDSPGANTREFLAAVAMVALKALDIPYSFFDESFTNFYGSVGAWRHYDRSCVSKRSDIQAFLNWWMVKRVALGIVRGELRIPAGLTLANPWWEFVPSGMPWWDPSKEINADLQRVMAGWGTPQQIAKERGVGDWFQNIEETGRALEFARTKGVSVSFAPQAPAAPDPVDDQQKEEKP